MMLMLFLLGFNVGIWLTIYLLNRAKKKTPFDVAAFNYINDLKGRVKKAEEHATALEKNETEVWIPASNQRDLAVARAEKAEAELAKLREPFMLANKFGFRPDIAAVQIAKLEKERDEALRQRDELMSILGSMINEAETGMLKFSGVVAAKDALDKLEKKP